MNRRINNSAIAEFAPAFSLIELMIAIAMVVLLMLGINTVFKMSSDTVGTGVAISDLTRADRSIQAVLQDDFRRSAKDAPLFIIHSGVASPGGNWMTLAEKNTDRDGNALTYLIDLASTTTTNEGFGAPPSGLGLSTPYSFYNNRNHRVDTLAFPIRGSFNRHTANDGSYTSPIKSSEAWVWYGHLAISRIPTPTSLADYFAPGEGTSATNSKNYFASTWMLGRYETLLKDPNLFTPSYPTEVFYRRNTATIDLPPLTPYTLPTSGNQRALNIVQSSRYDLAGTWLEQMRDDVSSRRFSFNASVQDGPTAPATSWWGAFVYTGSPFTYSQVIRYQANALPGKPMTSRAMSQMVPVLATGVSQFIVEYAGDFVTQDNNYYITVNGNQQVNPNYGFVLSNQPDGVTDYIVYGTSPNYPRLRTRWYGLPRDVTSRTASAPDTGAPDGEILAVPLANLNNANELVDVVPLADVLRTAGYNNGAAFERELPQPSGKFYLNGQANVGTGTAFFNNFRYTCVWQDGGPAMLRILVKMEDPGGRLPDGQWFEYVLGVP